MKKFTAVLCASFIIFTVVVGGGHSLAVGLEGEGDYQVYLPLALYDETNAWIGPDGGTVVSVVFDPQNPDTVYAGTYGGGVFKSLNGGDTWQAANQGLGNRYVLSLAVDPQNPEVIYAGTYKGKMYKSVDGGSSWFYSSEGIQPEAIVYTIAIDPTNTDLIYIGTRGISNNGGAPWRGIVYRSNDGGATWVPRLENIAGPSEQDWVYSIVVHPNAPNNVYVASHEHGAYHSDSWGGEWKGINEGIKDGSGRAILVDPQSTDPAGLYMGVWHGAGVYKSVDGGDNWILFDNGVTGAKVYSMAVDPSQSTTLYLSTFNMGVMKTTNGGGEWFGSGLRGDGIFTVAVNPEGSQVLFSGTAGDGLYGSIDGGDNWEHSQQGLMASSVTSLLVSADDSDELYASIYGGGVWESVDRGETWNEENTGLVDKFVHGLSMQPAEPKVLYALTNSAGLFRRDFEMGAEWEPSSTGLPAPTGMQSMNDLFRAYPGWEVLDEQLPSGVRSISSDFVPLLTMMFAPSNANIAYIGTAGAGMYKSPDGGNSWWSAGLGDKTVVDLVVDSGNRNIVFAATSDGDRVWVTMDSGVNWGDTLLPDATPHALSLTPDYPRVLYAGTDDGVYQLKGSDWTVVGLSGREVLSIAAHPALPDLVFAGTDGGAYVSSDGGLTWGEGPEELSGVAIKAISFDPLEANRVYFSTQTHGALRAYFELQGAETSVYLVP
jgi:photosystem II stability/assembly factor-like uncharacterized protein